MSLDVISIKNTTYNNIQPNVKSLINVAISKQIAEIDRSTGPFSLYNPLNYRYVLVIANYFGKQTLFFKNIPGSA